MIPGKQGLADEAVFVDRCRTDKAREEILRLWGSAAHKIWLTRSTHMSQHKDPPEKVNVQISCLIQWDLFQLQCSRFTILFQHIFLYTLYILTAANDYLQSPHTMSQASKKIWWYMEFATNASNCKHTISSFGNQCFALQAQDCVLVVFQTRQTKDGYHVDKTDGPSNPVVPFQAP